MPCSPARTMIVWKPTPCQMDRMMIEINAQLVFPSQSIGPTCPNVTKSSAALSIPVSDRE